MTTQVQTTFEARRYTADDAAVWDTFIGEAVNSPFLFKRGFMDYHTDRFEDFSYLVWRKKELVAVFVAGRARNTDAPATLVAHPGLTYGGLVYNAELKYPVVLEVYEVLLASFRAEGFDKLVIKPVGRVFCRIPSEANLFYFHQQGFKLSSRELNSVIDLGQPLRISKGRKDNVRKARNFGLVVEQSTDFSAFWPLLADNLWHTHAVRPPHSEAEIQLLHQRFPGQILLYVARQGTEVLGGTLVFLDEQQGFAHTQYISANEQGKQVGAVDAILAQVLADMAERVPRFSFGISTAKGELNMGLLAQKEGFGASIELLDVYHKDLGNG